MKAAERPRTTVIVVRLDAASRAAAWLVICGDCGSTSHKSKTAAEKGASKHNKEDHGGGAVIKVRQR
jgi:hypothetical protein